MQANDREIPISRPEKLLFPEDGITKKYLATYFQRIFEVLAPHIEDRPLMLHRFPDGIDADGFYQKQVGGHFPDWIETVSIDLKKTEGRRDMMVANRGAALVYLADQACIALHGWMSRRDRLNRPDKMLFDLDPPGNDFEPVRRAAQELHRLLLDVGLVSYVMTTGSKGLHIAVPLRSEEEFDGVRKFAGEITHTLAARNPEHLTVESRKAKRRGRLYLDTQRNAYGQTGIVPYSPRAIKGAPIATPLDWEELQRRNLHPRSYTMKNLFRRLGQKPDPWRDMGRHARRLEKPRQRLREMRQSRGES
jgi:bifunctional non-homologous end joining protein LigD